MDLFHPKTDWLMSNIRRLAVYIGGLSLTLQLSRAMAMAIGIIPPICHMPCIGTDHTRT